MKNKNTPQTDEKKTAAVTEESAAKETKKNETEEAKKAEKKDAVKAETAEATKAADDAETGETGEINTDDLFKHRVSIDMTPENSWFSASAGGLISLKIINAEGEEEFFERVVIRRSFPVTSPDEFLSVREPDTRANGRGSEIGMIRNIHIFDQATVDLINAELDIRYFTPVIYRITSAKEKFGYNYWEAETSAGKVSIVLNNPFSNIRVLEDGRVYIFDMDGNCFLIPDPTKVDRLTYRTIEIYL